MRTVIRVSCIDQQLKAVASPLLASGGMNEAVVAFDFCEKWDGFAKTGVFYRDEEDVYYSLLDENDECIIPHEVYDEPGTFYFTVFGDKDDIRRTASTLRYKAYKGVVGDAMKPSDPTPDVYDQIMAKLNGYDGGSCVGVMSAEQIAALNGMFNVCAYVKDDVSTEYEAFKTAFGLNDSGGGDSHTHSYTSSVTKAATCTTAGVRTFTCSCGHSYTEPIPATGHNYVDGVCSVCGATDPNHGGSGGDEPHEHVYASEVTTQATCTTDGVRTYTCSCGDTYTEPIPAAGHNFVDGVCTTCGANLVDEYQLVEYIEFDGNQRIATDEIGANNFDMRAVVSYPESDVERAIMTLSSSYSGTAEVGFDSKHPLFFYVGNYVNPTDMPSVYGSIVEIEAHYEYNIGRTLKCEVDGVTYTGAGKATKTMEDRRFVVGACGYDQQRYPYVGKIYSASYSANGTLLCDLVPCYRKSDNVIGMYDKVSRKFYTNAGTGTFGKGADVA